MKIRFLLDENLSKQIKIATPLPEKEQKWTITPDAVVRLSGCDRDSVNNFLQYHHLALSDHHAKHELTEGHN